MISFFMRKKKLPRLKQTVDLSAEIYKSPAIHKDISYQ